MLTIVLEVPAIDLTSVLDLLVTLLFNHLQYLVKG